MNICKRCKPQAGCDFQSIYHFLLVYQSPLQPLPSQILDIWKIFVPFSKTGRQKARLPERFAECTCEQQRPLHHGRTTSDAAEKHSSSFKQTHPSRQFWSYKCQKIIACPKYACVSQVKVPFTIKILKIFRTRYGGWRWKQQTQFFGHLGWSLVWIIQVLPQFTTKFCTWFYPFIEIHWNSKFIFLIQAV